MITENNFEEVLNKLGFCANGGVYEKNFSGGVMKADIKNRQLIYPVEIGIKTYDESRRENLVVFECVSRLLEKGYNAADIELEKTWTLGHEQKSGRADIVVSQNGKTLFIVECKTYGREFERERRNMEMDGGQLFSYWQQENFCKWLILYAAGFDGAELKYQIKSVNCTDHKNLLDLEEKHPETKLYKNAHTVKEKFAVWDETYDKKFSDDDVIFSKDASAYDMNVKPKLKCRLRDFAEIGKVVNKFEEILRHNNVSDKENAFNRLIALFICKLADESEKGDDDIVEFYYHDAADSYETLQDRLQRLHRDGMKIFMNEDIFYIADNYAEKLIEQYSGGRRNEFISELKKSLRQLKFYTNNDFAFKEVHNEQLFYQNGKVLREVVELFQNYRIIGTKDLQTLGDLFEQLLNKGFKQNEGQFFTPIPITRFIWDSLPLEKIISDNKNEPPKIIDYACGAGHFLTQGFAAIKDCFARNNLNLPEDWELDKIFGVEKDYRLARVSKISFFMHGVNRGKIKFGDGLENYPDENISAGSFDILVANPPYAVKNFRQHIKLKNEFATLEKISKDGSEIETLFVERIAQLLKPPGIAAVILPSSILNKDGKSFISARESLLQNFYIRAIAQFGSKTFSATGTNTVIVFLERLPNSPRRFNLLKDSVNNILRGTILEDWEDKIIFDEYIKKIKVDADTYKKFISRKIDYADWRSDFYFGAYVAAFEVKFALRDNYKFYDFVLGIEFEKIHYFAMTYNQTTLVISAPADNSDQEKFLGYSWSNAKGDEGIKIKTPGGLLYDNENSIAENRLAAAVRAAFSDKKVEIPEAEKYYSYLKLSDMLDFGNVDFTKTITLSNIPAEELTNRLFATEKLEKVVSINLETFDPTTTPDKKYHYVDISAVDAETNEINFSNEIVGENAPSRARRIANDNDVLISTVRPNLKSFAIVKNAPPDTIYSTGFAILTSKNPAVITNEFIFLLFMYDPLLMAQMIAKMGKGSYPSINQSNIKNFYILIPPIEIQRQIVSEFEAIDDEVLAQDAIIQKCDDDVRDKFNEMFSSITETVKLGSVAEIIRGVTYDKNFEMNTPTNNKILTSDNILLNGSFELKKIIYISDEVNLDESKKLHKNDIFICMSSGSIKHIGKTAFINLDTDFYAGGFMGIIRVSNLINERFLYNALNTDSAKTFLMNNATGSNIKNLSNSIRNMKIISPPIELQKEFAAFAQECDSAKESARRRKSELQAQREQLVEKYFR